MKRSGYLQRVRQDINRQLMESRSIHTQMCLDAAMIAANEVFNMGPSRAKAFADAFSSSLSDIATMTVSDGKSDKELWFTKSKLDERLKQICGDNFQPWEVRYGEISS